MRKGGFLDQIEGYLKEAGMEVRFFEGVEPDPSVETVMRGAKAMQEFEPDWIVAIGGGSPIDAAKAMWAFYEHPDTTFEDLIVPFNFPKLRTKAHFCAIPTTSGTATETKPAAAGEETETETAGTSAEKKGSQASGTPGHPQGRRQHACHKSCHFVFPHSSFLRFYFPRAGRIPDGGSGAGKYRDPRLPEKKWRGLH